MKCVKVETNIFIFSWKTFNFC